MAHNTYVNRPASVQDTQGDTHRNLKSAGVVDYHDTRQ